MTDKSKAQWPDGMVSETKATSLGWTSIYLWDNEHCYQCDINGDTKEEAEHRVKQICALPKMVELLKEMSEQSLFFENENGEYEGTEYHHDATAILREIGELE